LDELTETFENFRRQDLFLAEDFVGKIKAIGQKCHRRVIATEVANSKAIMIRKT
jgi:hypothetical protein